MRELLKMALDALEENTRNEFGECAGECIGCGTPYGSKHHPRCEVGNAIAALRAALAVPEAEPVAWIYKPHNELLWPREVEAKNPIALNEYVPLYATPQQAQPAENPWKDAVLDRLASASIDAPTDELPSRILDRIIEVEVMIALDHVPDGWVMVPRELFPSQLIASIVAAIRASDSNLVCSADEVSAVYRAMIAAAPAVREPQDNDCAPNHLCLGYRFVHLPRGKQCDRCGQDGGSE